MRRRLRRVRDGRVGVITKTDLLRGLVDEGLVTYDPAEGEATLTAAGADYLTS